ncbi:MAG: right-handed parallel beta-helix repeat-containing protein [Planctomycetota bacterium]|nr:right-handed parallel beta-helix repeat-containing protein [Planctomycetota bacterium]MDP6839684.1 right-handed parallel beta-helix repeat-containing protein [Planctomycetota bacterium]
MGLATLFCPPAAQALPGPEIFVDQSNPACPGDGSQANPFCSLQDALNSSADGDTLRVAPGTYFENVILEGRSIAVISTAGPQNTFIDAAGLGTALTFRNAGGTTPLFEGFTLQGGSGTAGQGGGLLIDGAAPTVRNCIITANHTPGQGGGVYCRNLSAPIFEDCVIVNNSSDWDGGGVFVSGGTLTMTDCVIWKNVARDFGGGLHLRDNPTAIMTNCQIDWNATSALDGGGAYLDDGLLVFQDCTMTQNYSARDGGGLHFTNNSQALISSSSIRGNRAFRDGGGAGVDAALPEFYQTDVIKNSCGRYGGGIFAENNSSLTFEGGRIWRNSAMRKHGGGLYLNSCSDILLRNCAISRNDSGQSGGGIYCQNSSTPRIEGCEITDNLASKNGGGIYLVSSSPLIDHCTFSLNEALTAGSAIYGRNMSRPVVQNSILWGDLNNEIILLVGYNGGQPNPHTAPITFSNIEGMWPGLGNINADPLFVNPGNGNFRLRAASPCRGAADDGSDMGAHQFGS